MNLKNNLFLYLIIGGCFSFTNIIKTSLEISRHQKLPIEIIHLIGTLADSKTKGRIFETREYFRQHLIDFNVMRLTPLCYSVLEKNIENANYKENQFWEYCKKNRAPLSIKKLNFDENIYNIKLQQRVIESGYLLRSYLSKSITKTSGVFTVSNKIGKIELDKKTFDLIFFCDKQKNTAIVCNTEIKDAQEMSRFLENIDKNYSENNIKRIRFSKNNFEAQLELISEKNASLLMNKTVEAKGENPALHDLAYAGHKDTLELLLKTGKNPNEKTLRKSSPLHSACYGNKIECVKILLEYGVDKNAQDAEGQTPLHIAVKNENREMVKLLLDNEIKINIRDEQGRTALYHSGHYECDGKVTGLFVKAGANADLADSYGDSPLHHFCRYKCIESTKILLEYGANPNIVNKNNETPLSICCQYGHLSMARLLLKNNAHLWLNGKPLYQLDKTIKACLR